jgi:hypothetical protein
MVVVVMVVVLVVLKVNVLTVEGGEVVLMT